MNTTNNDYAVAAAELQDEIDLLLATHRSNHGSSSSSSHDASREEAAHALYIFRGNFELALQWLDSSKMLPPSSSSSSSHLKQSMSETNQCTVDAVADEGTKGRIVATVPATTTTTTRRQFVVEQEQSEDEEVTSWTPSFMLERTTRAAVFPCEEDVPGAVAIAGPDKRDDSCNTCWPIDLVEQQQQQQQEQQQQHERPVLVEAATVVVPDDDRDNLLRRMEQLEDLVVAHHREIVQGELILPSPNDPLDQGAAVVDANDNNERTRDDDESRTKAATRQSKRLVVASVLLVTLVIIGVISGTVVAISKHSIGANTKEQQVDDSTAAPTVQTLRPTTASSPSTSTNHPIGIEGEQADGTTVTPVPSPHPTIMSSPSPSPIDQEVENLKEFLSSVSLDGGIALQTPSTPQNNAFIWLTNNSNLGSYSEMKRIQRYALATLYYSTNGDEWYDKSGWLTDQDECQWYNYADSVFCDAAGAIAELCLVENHLIGTIPNDVALLSDSIGVLNVGGNEIMGQVPLSLGVMTQLNKLYLWGNHLTGSIPSVLGQLTQLNRLSLYGNSLTGTIPTVMKKLSQLSGLSLRDNRLTGTIPSFIGKLTKLNSLHLYNNSLMGDFACPDFISTCLVSCDDVSDDACRSLRW